MDEFSIILGKIVKQTRHYLGLTMNQVAERAYVDIRTISNIEKGIGNPKFEILLRLIRVLNINPAEIFYPETYRESAHLSQLQQVISTCSDNEAKVILSATQAMLEVLRKKDE